MARDVLPPSPEQQAVESGKAEAAAAKAKLQLFRITTDRKLAMPAPDQMYELVPGSNHFEAPLPEGVLERLGKLQTAGTVKVELIDGDGKVTAWEPEPKK